MHQPRPGLVYVACAERGAVAVDAYLLHELEAASEIPAPSVLLDGVRVYDRHALRTIDRRRYGRR